MANHDKYDVEASDSGAQFIFFSNGAKGFIEKRVQYVELDASENIYNCAFGDWDERTQQIDDNIITDNGDRNKVLATVVGTIYDYTAIYPDRLVYFKGSNAIRTRIYGKIIFDHYDELINDFHIFGVKYTEEGRSEVLCEYAKEEMQEYRAFIVRRH